MGKIAQYKNGNVTVTILNHFWKLPIILYII
jgi:hypothetical protein